MEHIEGLKVSAAEEVVAGRKKDMAGNCLTVLLYESEEKVGRFPLLATIVLSGHARLASTFSSNYVSVPVLMVPLEVGAFQKGAQTLGVITFTHRERKMR